MATLTITIPDNRVNEVQDAFATFFDYNPAIDGTKSAFTKAQVIKWMKQVYFDGTARAAQTAAVAPDLT